MQRRSPLLMPDACTLLQVTLLNRSEAVAGCAQQGIRRGCTVPSCFGHKLRCQRNHASAGDGLPASGLGLHSAESSTLAAAPLAVLVAEARAPAGQDFFPVSGLIVGRKPGHVNHSSQSQTFRSESILADSPRRRCRNTTCVGVSDAPILQMSITSASPRLNTSTACLQALQR